MTGQIEKMGAWLPPAVLLLLLAAGLLKAWDLPGFASSLKSWPLIPAWSRPALSLLVVGMELAMFPAWLAGARRNTRRVAAGFVLAMACVYGVHLGMGFHPKCSCFGEFVRFETMRSGATYRMLMYAGLLVALLAPEIAGGAKRLRRALVGRSLPASAMPRAVARHRSGMGAGYSLVEVLVVLVVLGAIVALLLPVLHRARASGADAVAMSRLRSHAQVFQVYAQDFDDQWPCFVDPRRLNGALMCGSVDETFYYFDTSDAWPYVLRCESYYAKNEIEVFESPYAVASGDAAPRRLSSATFAYRASCAMLASPTYWDPTTRTGRDQWRSTRVGEVTFPSSKILLTHETPPGSVGPAGGVLVALADGAARSLPAGSIPDGYPTGDSYEGMDADGPSPSGHGWDGVAGQHTLRGVAGRDVGG